MKQKNKLIRLPYQKLNSQHRMAKRYTDSEKWKKDFIKTLPTEYKVFWLYLLDECDHAGIWNVELDIAEMRLGFKLSLERIRGLFKGKVVEFDNGTKWFIPDFISFQYGELDINNRAHKSVIERLAKYKNKGLTRVLRDPMDKDKDKDNSLSNNIIGGVGENLPGKPNATNVPDPPPHTLRATAEVIYRFKQTHVTNEQVLEYWQTWKVLNLVGEKFYASANDVYRHFTNSSKNENWKEGFNKQNYQTTEKDQW